MGVTLGLLRRSYGSTPAADFGPKKLRLLRDVMIRGEGQSARNPRPWSRRYINAQIKQLRHLFKWAASHELGPASVHQVLCTIEPLRRSRPGCLWAQRALHLALVRFAKQPGAQRQPIHRRALLAGQPRLRRLHVRESAQFRKNVNVAGADSLPDSSIAKTSTVFHSPKLP